MNRKRSQDPIGVFDNKTCFQTSYITEDGSISTSLFCELYPFLTVPSVGVYGSEYEPCQPIVFLELPNTPTFCKNMMKHFCEIPAGFTDFIFNDNDLIEFKSGVIVHSFPVLGPCQHFVCESTRCVSVMHHPWAFEGVDIFTFAGHTKIFTGIYKPQGIRKIHDDVKDVDERGMPLGFLGVRTVIIHDGSFSPCNCQFYLDENSPNGSSFFTVSWCPEKKKIAVMFHVLPGSPEKEFRLREELNVSPMDMSVGGLLKIIDKTFESNYYSGVIASIIETV